MLNLMKEAYVTSFFPLMALAYFALMYKDQVKKVKDIQFKLIFKDLSITYLFFVLINIRYILLGDEETTNIAIEAIMSTIIIYILVMLLLIYIKRRLDKK